MDSESRIDTQEKEPEPKGHCCGHGSSKPAAKPPPPKEAPTKRPAVERIFADYEDMDEYTLGFLERRKKYKDFQTLTADMRMEQI